MKLPGLEAGSVSAMSRCPQDRTHDASRLDVLEALARSHRARVDLLDVLRHRADVARARRIILVTVRVDRKLFPLVVVIDLGNTARREHRADAVNVVLLVAIRQHALADAT